MSAAGAATFNDKIIATELDISGNVDIDGVLETDNLTVGGAQGSDGQVLTSTGSGVGWEDAGASTVIQNNLAILAFQIATTTSAFNMQDRFIDDFYDDTGIDTSASSDYAAGIDSYTSLLIHSDDIDGLQSFTDSSGHGHDVYYNGQTNHSTDQAKFGDSSIHLDGSGDSLKLGYDDSLSFGTGDWTMELWWYPTSQASYDRFIAGGTSQDGLDEHWWFGKWPSNKFNIGLRYTTASYDESAGSWGIVNNNDVWHHLAMERDGGTIYCYMDGVIKHTQAMASWTATAWNLGQTNTYPFLIGERYSSGESRIEGVTGYVDEIRISKGIARYSGSNFTVATEAFGTETGTVGGGGSNMTLISTTQTAQTAPTKANLVFLMEDAAGTATLNTDIKAYVSRNAGTAWSSQVTLVDQGTWGTNKKILVANDIDISGITSGVAMRYKVTTHNQSDAKKTGLHGASLSWN
jgi:hypothetical protein